MITIKGLAKALDISVSWLSEWVALPFLWMFFGAFIVLNDFSLVNMGVLAIVFMLAHSLLRLAYVLLPKGWKND